MAERFSTSLPGRLNQLVCAYEQNDIPAAQTLAHRLAGTAGMYGFGELGSAARAFDEAVANDRPEEQIDDAYRQLCLALERAMAARQAA